MRLACPTASPAASPAGSRASGSRAGSTATAPGSASSSRACAPRLKRSSRRGSRRTRSGWSTALARAPVMDEVAALGQACARRHGALAGAVEARGARDRERGRVVLVDGDLDGPQPELANRPLVGERDRATRHTAAARLARDPLADLARAGGAVDL